MGHVLSRASGFSQQATRCLIGHMPKVAKAPRIVGDKESRLGAARLARRSCRAPHSAFQLGWQVARTLIWHETIVFGCFYPLEDSFSIFPLPDSLALFSPGERLGLCSARWLSTPQGNGWCSPHPRGASGDLLALFACSVLPRGTFGVCLRPD